MKKRDIGLDITRIVAFLFVVNVHSFLYNGFLDTIIQEPYTFVLCLFRILFSGCVPMFLMLSGYLLCGRKVDLEKRGELRRHLYRASEIVLTYVLCALAISLVRGFYLGQTMSLREMFFSVFSFGQYSWYANMYLGLYLLMPMLNLVWEHSGGERAHRVLVMCLLALTALPSLLNVYDLTTPGVFLNPSRYEARTRIVPDWWVSIYPVTYYFLGAYLRTHVQMKKLHTGRLAALLLLSLGLFTGYSLWQSWGRSFYIGAWLLEAGWQTGVIAVLVFLTLNSIDFPQPGAAAGKLLALLSELTFGAYLLSWIPDQLVYPMLFTRVADSRTRMLCFPITAAVSAVVSLGGAFAVRCVVRLLRAGAARCRGR